MLSAGSGIIDLFLEDEAGLLLWLLKIKLMSVEPIGVELELVREDL